MVKCFYSFLYSKYWYATTSTSRYKKAASLFCNLPTCSPNTLPLRCWYYSLQEDAWFPTIITQSSLFPIHRKTKPCDTLRWILRSLFLTGRFMNFTFLWIFSPNLILRTVPFTPSPPTAFISTLDLLSKFSNVSQNIVHCYVSAMNEFTNWHVLRSSGYSLH